MRNELQGHPTDLHQLAEDACRAVAKNPQVGCNDIENRHESLTAGLKQVRGVAVQQAQAANVRLRKQAVGATAVSFGIGVALGLLATRLRRVLPESAPELMADEDAALNV